MAPGAVSQHYTRRDLGRVILDGLRAAGKNVETLTLDDLAPVDHFHTRGKAATLELAGLAELRRDQRVLDVGGGLGGPARVLAAEIGCRVTVLDLTEEFCRVGEELTQRTRLGGRVEFRHGDALSVPFADGAFDVAWTQHATMNIADKARLYGELGRVVRPGGRLAMHEIMAGPQQPIHFPAHWARDPTISHLWAPEDVRRLIGELGFKELAWQDQSSLSLEWFRQRAAAARGAGGPPPLGLHLLLGPEFGAMLANMVRNLEEDRVRIIMAVWERAPR
jgi:ubiquinone/menaquinone biosynthesis C-methylase UbiE